MFHFWHASIWLRFANSLQSNDARHQLELVLFDNKKCVHAKWKSFLPHFW